MSDLAGSIEVANRETRAQQDRKFALPPAFAALDVSVFPGKLPGTASVDGRPFRMQQRQCRIIEPDRLVGIPGSARRIARLQACAPAQPIGVLEIRVPGYREVKKTSRLGEIASIAGRHAETAQFGRGERRFDPLKPAAGSNPLDDRLHRRNGGIITALMA